jgi:ribonuclease T1
MLIKGAFITALWVRGLCAIFLLLLGSVVIPFNANAKEQAFSAITEIALSDLPLEGRKVYKQIHEGVPFTHEKDGSVFGNRERILPLQKRGYYREYTVKTPWIKNRGKRRIVCGGLRVSQPDICYYTADHYASFRKIVP